MKLLNILLDFKDTSNTYVEAQLLTKECLDALEIKNKNDSNTRGVLVREDSRIVLYPENRLYSGYIIDFSSVHDNRDMYLEFLSALSSCNITTQIGYSDKKVRGNLSVIKGDETMITQLVFYGAELDRSTHKALLLRAVINILPVKTAGVIGSYRSVISSFETNKFIEPVEVDNYFFDYLYRTKGKTCQEIYYIASDETLKRDHELEFSKLYALDNVEVFDSKLSYTYNDLL
jgi:hypothetical protein